MTLQTHGEQKYGGIATNRVLECEGLRAEHRQIGPGLQNCVKHLCTEVVQIISGQARLRRRGDGQMQEGVARPGTSWLIPAGTHETLLEFDQPTECLVIFLPATLLEPNALARYGIDPDRTRLAYAGGFADPVLSHISSTLLGLLGRHSEPVDLLVAEGMRNALVARLIAAYTIGRWQPQPNARALDSRRLVRVLEFIDENLSEEISLADMAGKACLSSYHFSRLFHETVGTPPHRYVIERRIKAAQTLLTQGEMSLAQIALESGFSSQANFTRAFRNATGETPGSFRSLYRN